MLTLSPLLLWAVFQILICGSQTKPNGDPEYCLYLDAVKCQETHIKITCINLCKDDPVFCLDIRPDKCTEIYVNTSCPNKCKSLVTVAGCPSPWFSIGNQCFLVEPSLRKWTSARQYCEGITPGGGLAEPKDVKALQYYLGANGYMGTRYFLGGSDVVHEGEWRWNSGAKITESEMGNIFGDEYDCLGTYSALFFTDWRCELDSPFICQRHFIPQ